MAVQVIIDTDIGDDVDDALALALAARAPETAVVGVTTVFQPDFRKGFARRLGAQGPALATTAPARTRGPSRTAAPA